MDNRYAADAAPEAEVGLGGALLDDDAIQELLQQVTILAKQTVNGAQSVSLTVVQSDRYRTSNSTGPDALAVDKAQYQQGDGPCLTALRGKDQLQVRVGEDRERWPLFDDEAKRMGIAAVLSTPLIRNGGEAIGALNVYAHSAAFSEADARTTQLIGQHAAILVTYMLALADSSQLNEQLRQAVATREIIGSAKGILMQSQSCTRDEAFDILRRASQRENRKLRDIAEELVLRVEARSVGKVANT